MTPQQIQLKIESFMKYADKTLLDSVPLPGGRLRFFASNPQSYSCNYAVITDCLDMDETIQVAEEEFAGREIAPCRFFGAPDSVTLCNLMPAFLRHGYSVQPLSYVQAMAIELSQFSAIPIHLSFYWQKVSLNEREKAFISQSEHAEYAVAHLERLFAKGCGQILFFQQDNQIQQAILCTMQEEVVMINDDYTPLDYRNPERAKQMIARVILDMAQQGKTMAFVWVKKQEMFKIYREMGFKTIAVSPPWWAVKGKLPQWLKYGSKNCEELERFAPLNGL